jgi:hypothetical protein
MEKTSKIQFIIGIILALISAVLMTFGYLPLPARITVLIVGLALIATSTFKLME